MSSGSEGASDCNTKCRGLHEGSRQGWPSDVKKAFLQVGSEPTEDRARRFTKHSQGGDHNH